MDERDQELAERIGDYLDDRLSPDERAAFEEAVRREPQLGERLAELRMLREAVRGAEVELPPGFAARSRARFEASRPGAWRLPRFAIPAAAGIAAVALIAFFLFEQAPELSRPPVAVARDADAETERAPSTDAKKQAERPVDSDRRAVAVSPDAPGPRRERAEAHPPAPPTEAPQSLEERLAGDAAAGAHVELQAQPMPVRGVGLPAELMDEARPTSGSETSAKAGSDSAERMPPRVAQAAPAPPPTETQPDVVVVASADAVAWERLTERPEGRALAARLAPDFRSERVVLLLAPGPSFDCNGITVEQVGDALVLRAGPRVEALAESFAGCALVLPAGAGPIRFAP